MTKFNTTGTRAATGTGPITVQPGTEHVNHQGGIGYTRDDKSDLFLLATTSLDLTADAFYERGDARVKRYTDLIGRVATADPDWTYRFLTWLRTKGNIRTAALVGGVEAARALAASGIPGGRHMVSTVLRRADEPGEAIAYHLAVHGRRLPKPVKRGVADAVGRLYTEYGTLKWDTASHGVRFADVLDLTHPDPAQPFQLSLFPHLLDRRHGRDNAIPTQLTMLRENARLTRRFPEITHPADPDLAPDVLRAAGMNWEDVLSALGSKVDKAALWHALIPSMGFMARLRNLRNFDQAGLHDDAVRPVIDMLSDPEQVRNSKQLPLRFLSAYRAAPSLRWSYPLERALDLSVENIPSLPGRTLILVDTSGSMADRLSAKSELRRWDAAASFGLALARRAANADVVSYSGGGGWGRVDSTHTKVWGAVRGESLLSSVKRWNDSGYFLNGGTDTVGALKRHFAGHDRVVLLTDEQDGGFYGVKVTDTIPKTTPLYTFNLAGYESSHAATDRNRLTFGGLTDHMFGLIDTVERGYPGGWPWAGDESIGPLPTYPATAGAVAR